MQRGQSNPIQCNRYSAVQHSSAVYIVQYQCDYWSASDSPKVLLPIPPNFRFFTPFSLLQTESSSSVASKELFARFSRFSLSLSSSSAVSESENRLFIPRIFLRFEFFIPNSAKYRDFSSSYCAFESSYSSRRKIKSSFLPNKIEYMT